MADKINAAGYETKPWWPYVRELMEGGGSVTVEQLNVTENGTYTAEAGKAYSPVVVNVAGGSSDFSTAKMTVVGEVNFDFPTILVDEQFNLEGSWTSSSGLTSPYTIILYKGKAYLEISSVESTSGSIALDSETGLYVVTGDCSITLGSPS